MDFQFNVLAIHLRLSSLDFYIALYFSSFLYLPTCVILITCFLYSNQLFIFSSHPIPFHPIPFHFISSNKQFHTSSSFLPSFPSLLPLHRILRQHIDRPAIHIQHRVLHAHSELPQLLRHLLAPIELRLTSLLRSHINSRLHAERHARRQRRAAADRRRVDVVQPDVVPDVVREILEIQFLFHHRATKYPRFLELL